MNKFFFQIAPMLAGLLIAQCISTFYVYTSNIQLYDSLISIFKAGYLTVPSITVMQGLVHLEPALLGAFFFTFSIGVGITIFTMTILWIRDHFFSSNRIIAVLMLPATIVVLCYINQKRLLPIASLFFILIPLTVTLIHIKILRYKNYSGTPFIGFVPLFGIIFLGIVWYTQFSNELFTTIRDRLLFSNKIGVKIADFYYSYNLYPIEAIKSLSQKTLRTSDLSDIIDAHTRDELTSILENYEYLDTGPNPKADLHLLINKNKLTLRNQGRNIVTTDYNSFKKKPWFFLNEFSTACDTYSHFRRMTLYSLLIGLPVSFYLLFFYLFRSLIVFFCKENLSIAISTTLCIFFGLLLLIPILNTYDELNSTEAIENAITSDNLNSRLHALKTINEKHIEIALFPAYIAMADSPYIAERYWLARALSMSQKDETLKVLFSLLNDPHPNVLCQVFYSLGVRKIKSAIKPIMIKMEEKPHWYVQWYAYQTIRALGWKQQKSD